jgi:hypothetical protein
MDAKEEIKKTVVTEPLKEAIKWFLASGSSFLLLCIPKVYAWLSTHLFFGLVWAIIGIEFLTISTLLPYVFYLRRKVLELTPVLFHKFGIQWDKELSPHCPKCANRLGPYAQWYMNADGFQCFHCNKIYPLYAEDGLGTSLSLQDAMKALQTPKPT